MWGGAGGGPCSWLASRSPGWGVLWKLVGRRSRLGTGTASEGAERRCLGLRRLGVGEPVQPEPGPQGSWGRGPQIFISLTISFVLLPPVNGLHPWAPLLSRATGSRLPALVLGPPRAEARGGGNAQPHCLAGLLPGHSSLGYEAVVATAERLAHLSASGPRAHETRVGGVEAGVQGP